MRRPRTAARTLLAALAALMLVACERGHYVTRDRVVTEEGTGGEANAEANADANAEANADVNAEADANAEANADAGADPEAQARGEGRAPEDARPRAPAETGPIVELTVRSSTGPVTLGVARRVIDLQRNRIDHCYSLLLATDPEATGTIRAVLTVESTGVPAAELETMAPALDRTLGCIDAVLERGQFPAATDGRRSHVILEVSLAPRR